MMYNWPEYHDCNTFDNCHAFRIRSIRCFGSSKERLKVKNKNQNAVLQPLLLTAFLQTLILNSKHCFPTIYTNTLLVCNYAICIKQLLCSPKFWRSRLSKFLKVSNNDQKNLEVLNNEQGLGETLTTLNSSNGITCFHD